MENPTKDIAVNEVRYQLGRYSARDGSWLVGQFLPHMMGALDGTEVDEKQLGLGLAASFASFTEETYGRIQAKALAVVRRYDAKDVPMPLFMADGQPIPPALDLVELTTLTVASLVFNLHCFFAPGAARTLRQVFPDLSTLLRPSAPGSTATS